MKNHIRIGRLTLIIICCALLCLSFSTELFAQESKDDNDKWRFELTPYFLAAGLNGKTGVGGVIADVDMSFSDIWDHLDIGGMLAFEVRKGRLLFLFDGIYFRLEDERTKSWQGPGGILNLTAALDATVTQQLYQLSAGYRAVDEGTKLDLFGAMRYTRLDIDLNLVTTTGGTLLPGGTRSLSDKEDWWDPVFGVRLIVPFAKKWSILAYGDAGGLGIGSDITYQAIAGVNWQFSKVVSAKLAYRYLYQDYKNDNFIWDMTAYGPILGIGFRW